jgi:CRP-like cAMP-binding protein
MALHQLLRKIPLFAVLKPSDLDRLEKYMVRRRYRNGQVLFHMGDEGGNLYIIQRGRVKVTIPSATGEEVILAILDAGEIIGELSLIDGKPRSATVQAMEESEILCLYREDFLDLLRDQFDMVLRMMVVLAGRLRLTDALLAESHFLDITSRLSKKILDLGIAFGIEENNTVRIGVRVTQKDLASMVGATRESVNKQLKVLREQGLIKTEKGYIEILDRERLERRARNLTPRMV